MSNEAQLSRLRGVGNPDEAVVRAPTRAWRAAGNWLARL